MAAEAKSDPDEVTTEQCLETDVVSLRSQAEALREELKMCRDELQKLQKQLSQSERIQKTMESLNGDLRQQVGNLSAEIHEKKKRDREKVDAETQTEEYSWTETDYYNYYYGGYYQSETETTAETQENVIMETQETLEPVEEQYRIKTEIDTPEQTDEPIVHPQTTEASEDSGSIADMLRATAEEAMNQTNFVFDESSGMYYDHGSGFYYDSASQLYYDANTAMYYYYDTESGKYQFHSRIEMPTTQPEVEQTPQRKSKVRKKNRKSAKNTEKASCSDAGDPAETELLIDKPSENHPKTKKDDASMANKSRRSHSRSPEQSKRSRSHHEKKSPRRREKNRRSRSRSDDSHSRRRRGSGSHSDNGRRRKKRKHIRRSRSDDGRGESELEEGEITDEPSPRSRCSSESPVQKERDSPERNIETETQTQEEAWPPCVRVTVVRSPVLETGTLFILTADAIATIGREKDMDHAIRIPEVGVSKSHAEVYFDQDQQCYVLVDQGSQNGTVINGNRILQPKLRCNPWPLTHGDEVKMGETVLSFHIHVGTATCDGCEPGQIIAHLSRFKRDESSGGGVLSKEDKEAQRQKELKMLKVKYGLKSGDYEDAKTLKNSKYKDRAENRRQTFGSEGTFQRDDAPASVHVEIGDENKGRQMLQKMGWKLGEGLGKDSAGIKDPIQLHMRKAQSGLGSAPVTSIDDASLTRTKSSRNWERARERFSEACHGDSGLPENNQSPASWVKSQESG